MFVQVAVRKSLTVDHPPQSSYRFIFNTDSRSCQLDVTVTEGQNNIAVMGDGFKPFDVVLLVYDITSIQSFTRIPDLYAELVQRHRDMTSVALIGNKSDLAAERKVTYEAGLALATKLQCPFFETTAKNETGISDIIRQVLPDKRYGCTSDGCFQRFEGKRDWMEHEHREHQQQECWQCCGEIFYERTSFINHYQGHKDKERVREALEERKISRSHQGRYWCGYCTEASGDTGRIMVCTAKKGIEADQERFNHIEEHMKGGKVYGQWVQLDGRSKEAAIQAKDGGA
jgi:Fe2+ transport system protein B